MLMKKLSFIKWLHKNLHIKIIKTTTIYINISFILSKNMRATIKCKPAVIRKFKTPYSFRKIQTNETFNNMIL